MILDTIDFKGCFLFFANSPVCVYVYIVRWQFSQIPYEEGNEKRRNKGKARSKKKEKESPNGLTCVTSDCLMSLKEGLASRFTDKQRSNTSQKWGGQRGP